jgi:hypothetical protein
VDNTKDDELKAEKYMNDLKLLDIRCGVLEEERTEYIY